MKKQLTLLAAVSAASLIIATPSFAGHGHHAYKGETYKDMPPPCPEPRMLRDGFYAGIQAGYDSYRIRTTTTTPDVITSTVLANTGWVGGLFLGYGRYMTDLFYLGGEIFANYNGSTTSNNFSIPSIPLSGFASTKIRQSYGLALLPGIKLNDTTLGYIRLGYNWASIRARSSARNPATGVVIYNNSKTNTSGGFNFGLGLETLLVDNWSVRTEFSHTWYNSFNVNSPAALATTKFNPSDNQFMLGLIYHFA